MTLGLVAYLRHLRYRLKIRILRFLRRTGISRLIKCKCLSICNDYIQIESQKLSDIFTVLGNTITVSTFLEEDLIPPPMHVDGVDLGLFQSHQVTTKTILIDAINSIYSFQNNHLLDDNLNVIGGYRLDFEKLPIYTQQLSVPQKVNGIVAYLSEPSPSNYYHWMCATLPLLRFYRKNFSLDEIDFFYIGDFPMMDFHRESLKRAGIKAHQILQTSCKADRTLAAISTRFAELNDPINKRSYFFTRKIFNDVLTDSYTDNKRRIYVSRGNVSRRRVVNEEQVINLLKHYHFEVVQMDGKTVEEQAKIFCQAEAIIAPHGAALANLLFINPGTKVIEIIPFGYTNNCFYVLAAYGEADYFCLQGDRLTSSNVDKVHRLNIFVNIEKLEKICQLALY